MPLPHFGGNWNPSLREDYAFEITSSFYDNRDFEIINKDYLAYGFYKIIKDKHQSDFEKDSHNYSLCESLFFLEDIQPHIYIKDCTDDEWERVQDFFYERYNLRFRKEKLSKIF